MSEPSESDEFTPRERGLLIGHAWATGAAHHRLETTDDPRDAIETVAESGVVNDEIRELVMRAGMAERLRASNEPNAEDAFWRGFVRGVRAYVVMIAIGGAGNGGE